MWSIIVSVMIDVGVVVIGNITGPVMWSIIVSVMIDVGEVSSVILPVLSCGV